MFGVSRDDGGADLLHPWLASVSVALLKQNGAVACLPPVSDGNIALLVGEKADQRLLSS
jgi:hypothetical protein